MKRYVSSMQVLSVVASLFLAEGCLAGQAPGFASARDVPVSHRDRVYVAEQFSNTVSVIDPVDNALIGVVRLGDPQPANFSPLYRGQVLVHGLGFSPDHKTLAVVSIGSNSVTFIDTETNAVRKTTYLGRSPHEAFFTPDGKEVWVTVRGEDYVAVLDARTYEETSRIRTPNGPGMQMFSPDGKYGYVCSSFTPETVVVAVATHTVVGRITQASPFCPNIAASPDGRYVWFTLKDTGQVQVFEASPPFHPVRTIDTGPITNHVNFVVNQRGTFAYVTVGGLNQVKVFRADDFERVATIAVGDLPHGIWPSGDGTRVYVGLENDDALVAIDTMENKVIASTPIGQAPQALVYVTDAVAGGDGRKNLQPPGIASDATHLKLASVMATGTRHDRFPTSVSLFNQGLVQVFQAAVTGLEPKSPYVIALVTHPDGTGTRQSLSSFSTNPAGAAIVNAAGQIRQIVKPGQLETRRYLAIFEGADGQLGKLVQIQAD